MKKILSGILLLMLAFVLTACSSAEEDVFKALEEVVVQEEEFEKQQEPLVELEEKEQEIFDKIMALNMDDFEEISTLADEAIKNLSARQELIDKEKSSMEKSSDQFKKAEDKMKSIKDDKLKEQADKISVTMKERYDSYDEIYSTYKTSIDENKKIYELLKNEDLKLEDLESQIEVVNDTFVKIITANETFNELTEKFNDEKMDFYKAADLDVEVEK